MLELTPYRSSSRPFKILCLGAHADDIEIGCGGTLLHLTKSHPNTNCTWIVFSGSPMRRREAEISAARFLRKAARKQVELHKFRDGFFPYHGAEVKECFEDLKRRCNPDLIFTHYRHDLHQDHRLICELTWNTFRRHAILEYEIPKYDGDLGAPNAFVPLDNAIARRKIDIILAAFKSQAGKHWFDRECFDALMRLRGLESACRYAEAFYGRKILIDLK